MSRLVRAELLKVRTTRLWWMLLLGAIAWVAVNVVLTIAFAGQQDSPGLETDAAVGNAWAASGQGALFALIIGILLVTGEFRHMTITSTFLAVPRRGRVIAAKLLAAAIVGLIYAVVAVLVTAAIALPLLELRNATGSADVAAIALGALVATALYAVVGVGVGALIRQQVAAIVGALIWVVLVEALIVAFLPEIGKWLPGGAANAMLQATVPGGDLLSPWAGGLVFIAYGLVFAVIGSRLTVSRDIT